MDSRATKRSEAATTRGRDAADMKFFQKLLEDAGDDEQKVRKRWAQYAPDRPIPGRTMADSRPGKEDPGFFEKAAKYLFGSSEEEAPAQKPAGSSQNKTTALPPAAAGTLKEGKVTTFNNGQRWTIRNGQPTQVQ